MGPKIREHCPDSLREAYRRIDDPAACVCGRCRWIRSHLEEKVAEARSDHKISVNEILKTKIYCRKAGVSVAPLESSCYFWRPARNPNTIWITYKWSKNREFR